MYVCMYIYICVYIYIYMYIYAHGSAGMKKGLQKLFKKQPRKVISYNLDKLGVNIITLKINLTIRSEIITFDIRSYSVSSFQQREG